MELNAEPGSPVPDAEDVFRAILYPHWWVESASRPSSAAFSYDVFSVDIVSRTTAQRAAGRFREVIRLVRFNCGAARGVSFDARDELDPSEPENLAHAHVYHVGNKSRRKANARALADLCSEVQV